MKEKIRYYTNRKKIIHTRKDSWFNPEREEVYKKNFKRIKGLDNFSPYIDPKPKPKPKPKSKAKAKKVKKGDK